MKRLFFSIAPAMLLIACADPRGAGFSNYSVPAKSGSTGQGVQIEWNALAPIPRTRLDLVGNAAAAAAAAPATGVASVSAPAATLNVIEDGSRIWLVAKAATAPSSAALRTEAEQRSGCLVKSGVHVGATLVFALNCR